MSVFQALRSRRHGMFGWLLTALLSLGLAAPANGHDVRVNHRLFGVHDASLQAGSRIHPGSVRLWDTGTQWQQIETSRHHYDWTRLDQLVSAAQAAHQEVTMVVAMTPSFYASDPTRPPRKLSHYTDFVRALMKRYRDFHGSRGIDAYMVWNEANLKTFWSGSFHTMAKLSRLTYRTRNHVDPGAKVVAPSMLTARHWAQQLMQQYYTQRVGGKSVARYYDAIAVTLYPFARANGSTGTPEDTMRLLAQVRRLLRADGVRASKPIWTSEVNYGLQSGDKLGQRAAPISDARQASFVARTFLLNAAHGVTRVFWYRYDMGLLPGGGTLANTRLSKPGDPSRVTRAGKAFALVQKWMHGRLVGSRGHRPCATDRHGTYTCVVRDSSGTRRVYWNPSRKATVRLAANAHHLQGIFGGVTKVEPHSRITVTGRPVMAGH